MIHSFLKIFCALSWHPVVLPIWKQK